MKPTPTDAAILAGCLLLALVVLAFGLVGCSESSRLDGQRLVLITLDTLRYDSFAGSPDKPSTMPYLRRWAEQATVFERFFAATAATQPSHASMFTGLQPWEHGVTGNRLVLGDQHVTVAERLRAAGYSTTAVVASLPVSERFGFAQGFEHFDDEFVAGEAHAGADEAPPEDAFYSLAGVITARALAQLDATVSRQQFLWFHYFDPHSPYGDTADGTTIRPQEVFRLATAGKDTAVMVENAHRLYDTDVASLDRILGRLLDRLEHDAAEFETHIVIVADHGESFGEDGSFGHGRRLIASQLHVPCLIRSPRLAAGVRGEVAGSIDIAATLLALAGVDEPARSRPFASRDLTQPARASGSRAFGMRRTWQKSHRDIRLDGTVHVLDDHLFFMVDPEGRLYRGNDEQLLPVGLAVPEKEAQEMRRLFGAFENRLSENGAQSDDDPEVEEALRSLGYVG